MPDNSLVRELALRGLENARREADQYQAILDALDARCLPSSTTDTESDFDEANLISTGEAACLAGVPKDTIRRWCRDYSLGSHKGGRWLVSVPRLLRHIGRQ